MNAKERELIAPVGLTPSIAFQRLAKRLMEAGIASKFNFGLVFE